MLVGLVKGKCCCSDPSSLTGGKPSSVLLTNKDSECALSDVWLK